MVDQLDAFVNITISITAEGHATIACNPSTDCTQTVVQNTNATVHFDVTNNTANSDTIFGALYDTPGMTGGNMVGPELFRETFTANQTKSKTVMILMGTTPFAGSIRVGHVVG